MKLSPLLAQFLYTNKDLKLSGIGKFVAGPSFSVDSDSKSQRSQSVQDISFQYDPSVKEDDELINFISANTGKMKSLAAADLDSHLEQARQFLNIGKPFFFEGIGTLVKQKSGVFEFTPGQVITEKAKETRESQASTTEESFSDYEEMFSPKKPGPPIGRKLAIAFGVLAGISLAVWGGYYVYKKTTANNSETSENIQATTTLVDTNQLSQDTAAVNNSQNSKDSATVVNKPDTAGKTINNPPANTSTPIVSGPAGNYKFIIEISPILRAADRFSKLKSYGLNIKIDSTNPAACKLFFMVNAVPSDTLHIKDSISMFYVNPVYMKSGKAIIEK